MSSQEYIAEILMEALQRDVVLAYEAQVPAALARARKVGSDFRLGHRRSVVGQFRHFALQEAFAAAFEECGIEIGPVRGNQIVVGKSGIARIIRVHLSDGPWDNSRRSKLKRKLCAPNKQVAALVQPDLLEGRPTSIDAITVIFVTQGDGTEDSPAQLFVVVTSDAMDLRHPIFAESAKDFVQRFQEVVAAVDNAKPVLKAGVKKHQEIEET